jgi:hypothetical protein
MTVAGAVDVVAELRRLLARLPSPDARWHAHVPLITAVREDFAASIEAAAGRPAELELFEAMLAGEAEPVFAAGADPALEAAYERLQALPVPGGQHPFLDEILPALEAAELLLCALGATE